MKTRLITTFLIPLVMVAIVTGAGIYILYKNNPQLLEEKSEEPQPVVILPETPWDFRYEVLDEGLLLTWNSAGSTYDYALSIRNFGFIWSEIARTKEIRFMYNLDAENCGKSMDLKLVSVDSQERVGEPNIIRGVIWNPESKCSND